MRLTRDYWRPYGPMQDHTGLCKIIWDCTRLCETTRVMELYETISYMRLHRIIRNYTGL